MSTLLLNVQPRILIPSSGIIIAESRQIIIPKGDVGNRQTEDLINRHFEEYIFPSNTNNVLTNAYNLTGNWNQFQGAQTELLFR